MSYGIGKGPILYPHLTGIHSYIAHCIVVEPRFHEAVIGGVLDIFPRCLRFWSNRIHNRDYNVR